MPLLWSFSLVQLSPSLAFFKVSTFLLTEARQDRCTANLCQTAVLLQYMTQNATGLAMERYSSPLAVIGYLPTQADDKRCVHIKGTWTELKLRLLFTSAWKEIAFQHCFFLKKTWVCRFHSETFIPWTPVLFCRRGLFYPPACKRIGMW